MRIKSPRSSRDRTPFIGRQRECDQLHAALDRGAGLISLTGPSGIGKTRLARRVAAERVDLMEAEGGAWFCSLAGCTNAADLESAVARTLGIHHGQGDALARSIANRGPLLLVLDNADPIVEGLEGVLGRWLEQCVELQMIVTSVPPTRVAGEISIELQPLEAEDAVALYLERAQSVWADHRFSQEEKTAIQELVGRLDRLPLAIELAAGRARILPPRTMLSMVRKRFDLLRSNAAPSRTAAHQASLLGAIELTWSHLDPVEQRALAQIAIFEGSFTAKDAAAVIDLPAEFRSDGEAPWDVSCLLDDLSRKSLLAPEDSEPPRYRLLESVKEFAGQQQPNLVDVDQLVRRHAARFLGPLDRRIAPVGPTGTKDLRQLKANRDDLLAIHRRFLRSDPALAARAGITLAPLVSAEGPFLVEMELIEAVLDAAKRSGEPVLHYHAMAMAYGAFFLRGKFAESEATFKELLGLLAAAGEVGLEALTLSRLAIVYLDRGDLGRSRPLLERATLLGAALDDPFIEGSILMTRGLEAIEGGRFEEAERRLRRATELLRERGMPGSRLGSLYHLGLALANQGRHTEARQVILEAIEDCRSSAVRSLEAQALASLSSLELSAGFLDEAEAMGLRSRTIFRELGSEYREGTLLATLGLVAMERGDLALAQEHLSRSEQLLGSRSTSRPWIGLLQAFLEARRHQLDEARRLLEDSRHQKPDRGDEVRLIVEGVEGMLELAEAWQLSKEDPTASAAKVERARTRLGVLQREPVRLPSHVPVIARLLERELAAWSAGAPSSPPGPTTAVLNMGPAFDWFRLREGETVSLRSRRALRGVFAALAKARLDNPRVGVRSEELARAGWPDEPDPDAATKRVRHAIWLLRNLGLRTLLHSDANGFLLDPNVPIRLEDPANRDAGRRSYSLRGPRSL